MSQIDPGLTANAPDVEADIQQSRLYNADLAPVPASGRKWGMLSFAALWISMSACIPTYMLASGLISGGQFACFLPFWASNMVVIYRGIDTIRWLLNIKAPLLIALGLLFLFWAYRKAGGFGPILSQPSQFDVGQPKAGQFWKYFFPAL